MSYTNNIKLGDLVAIAHQNSFEFGMFLKFTPDNGAHYRWLPYPNQAYSKWATVRIEKLEAGETSLGRAAYINTRADSRILPISENLLTELQARYFKFYRSKLNLHEYQDNRPGYSL